MQHNLTDKKSSEILANALNQEKKTSQLAPVQSPIQENEAAEQSEQQQLQQQQPFAAPISPIPPPTVPGPLPAGQLLDGKYISQVQFHFFAKFQKKKLIFPQHVSNVLIFEALFKS